MAPKRVSSPRGKGRAAKAAKTEPEGQPWEKDIEEVVAALASVSSLPATCREMVEAMTPHCLLTPRSERHEFQNNFAQSLSKLFSGEEVSRQAAVEAVEAEIAALREEESGASGKIEEASQASSAAEGRKNEAAAVLKAAQQATAEASEALAAAQKAKEGAATEVVELKQQTEKLEAALAEHWEPLMAGSFVGKEWRKRDKVIAQIVQLLKGFGAAESLIQAVTAAFKSKVESRGMFAQKSLEHGKDAFVGQISSIKEKLDALEAKPLEATVTEAEAAVKAAQEKEAETFESCISAENAWAEAETAAVSLRDAQRAFGPRADGLAKKLDDAKTALAEMLVLVAKLAELEKREKQEEAAEVEPAEEEVAEGKEGEAVEGEATAPAEGEAQA